MTTFIFYTLLILKLSHIESARILAVFPTPSISHQIVFRPLTNELVRRGHDVTVITADPLYPVGQAPKNLTEIDTHDMSYTLWRDELAKGIVGGRDDIYTQIQVIFRTLSKIFISHLELKEVDDVIKKKNGEYDLLLIEAFTKSELIYSHLYKVPVIQISSFGGIKYNYKVFGSPTHPLLYPTQLHQRLYSLSKWEKIQQLISHWWLEYYMDKVEQENNKILKAKFGPDTPTINELSNNVDMLFVNVHPIWIDNQPLPPNVVYIGGIHVPAPKELPKDLKNLLDSSKNGVIYFSLGTNVDPSLLSPEKIQMIIKVFSQLPYDILWKWNKDVLPGQTENIKIFKWFPQYDLLRHPKVKLFITQGGLQSTQEAITAGVPLIGIPMLADQWYNVEKYVYHKIGVQLDISSLTEDEFIKAIRSVIEDKSYRENIIRLRTLMEDETLQPLERAVWWVDYVLRHNGAKHLRAAGANVTWAQYLEIELLITTLVILLSILIALSFIMYKFWNFKNNFVGKIKIKIT